MLVQYLRFSRTSVELKTSVSVGEGSGAYNIRINTTILISFWLFSIEIPTRKKCSHVRTGAIAEGVKCFGTGKGSENNSTEYIVYRRRRKMWLCDNYRSGNRVGSSRYDVGIVKSLSWMSLVNWNF